MIVSACKKDKPLSSPTSQVEPVTINGTSYSTAKIGSQLWTTVNYNGPGGKDITNPNDSRYGKLYSLTEVTEIAQTLKDGWRIPTQTDYENLLISVSAKVVNHAININADQARQLMAKDEWSTNNEPGTNISKFNAYPAGAHLASSNTFVDKGVIARFWASSVDNNNNHYSLFINSNKYISSETSANIPSVGNTISISIRFVKDIK